MKKPRFWEVILFVLGIFLMFFVTNSVAYMISSHLFKRYHLPTFGYFYHIETEAIGLIIFLIVVYTVSRFTRKNHLKLWHAIIDALRSISKGNFDIHLDIKRGDHQFISLVENINHMASQLQQMEGMRQEFISNVSHEIQSPLTSISGFARALKEESLSHENRLHYLSIIEAESSRLSKISDNLLKLTSLESQQHPFEKSTFRLDQQIRNIILACEPHWAKKNIEMDVALDEVSIYADRDLLSQVWMNLLHNSIKFTPNEGKINIYLYKKDAQAFISIQDSGIGISIEDQIHIFERFYKADKSRTRSTGGSGLGLSIVKKIVEMHAGEISVESEIGKGATFNVVLPVL